MSRARPTGWGPAALRKFCYILGCFALAACGDPIADIPRLSEQDIPEDAGVVDVAAAPTPEGGSLIERLLGDAATAPDPAKRTLVPSDPMEDAALVEPAADPTAEPDEKPGGLLGFLTRSAPPKDDVATDTGETEPVQVALTSPDPTPETEPAALPDTPEPKRKGLFSTAAQPAVSEIAPGTVLPYGKVARICGLPKRELGTKIAQYPEKRPKHRIYDSNPGSTAPHSFYITGFADGCARQFTASLAMFGSVEMHEQLRYGLPAEVQPYSDTDKAYEKLKSRVCGVPRKKPCGNKVSRLDGNTVFVSIYERFGSNPRWTNLLLHDGDVLAQDQKGL